MQWVEVTDPAVASDHQRVPLILAQGALNDSTTRSVRPIQYPISSQHPEWVRQALLSELIDRDVGRAPSTRTWDDQVLRCVAAITTVRKRSKQRSKRYTSKVQRQTRVDLTSRQQLIHANQVTLCEECLIQEVRRLERTTDCLRWDFKQVFDWKRDQMVTDLHQLHGEVFSCHATIADKFATEWQAVLGRSHNTTVAYAPGVQGVRHDSGGS